MFALHNWPVLVPDEAAVMLRFLTLTVKSCSPENLPETIDLMMQGLGRLLDKTKRTRLRITSD